MELRDGVWTESVTVTADTKAALTKKVAAVNRMLKKLAKEDDKPRREKGEGSLFKRGDGIWVGRVELPPGTDGIRRRSKPVYSADRAEAVKKLSNLKEEIAKGLDQVDKRVTVEAWLTKWIEEIAKPRMRPHPWKSYRGMITNQIVPAIGKRQLASLKPEHIRYMHRHILESTYTRRDKETGEKVEVQLHHPHSRGRAQRPVGSAQRRGGRRSDPPQRVRGGHQAPSALGVARRIDIRSGARPAPAGDEPPRPYGHPLGRRTDARRPPGRDPRPAVGPRRSGERHPRPGLAAGMAAAETPVRLPMIRNRSMSGPVSSISRSGAVPH